MSPPSVIIDLATVCVVVLVVLYAMSNRCGVSVGCSILRSNYELQRNMHIININASNTSPSRYDKSTANHAKTLPVLCDNAGQ